MKRSSRGPRTSATSAPLVEPTSVTTASSPLDASASETSPGSARTGAAQKTTSAPSTASAIESSDPVDRLPLERALAGAPGQGRSR